MRKTIIAISLSALVLLILFGNKLSGMLGMSHLVDLAEDDPFEAYRIEFGSFSEEEYTKERGDIRVVLAHRKGGPGLPEEADVDSLDRSYKAFVKAFDLRPSGWHLQTNKSLWDEFADFYEAYGPTNEQMFSLGQFVS